MALIDEIRKNREKNPPKTGKIWLTLLIEYDLNGDAKVLRSFSKPAKDSSIKGTQKKKATKEEEIEFKTGDTERKDIFK